MSEPTVSHSPGSDPTLGAIVHDLTTQVPELIRSEMRLAQAEVAEKGKRAGIGIGMFSAAGLLAFFGVAALLTTIVLALDLMMPAWLAALIVTVVLFAGAGILALQGRNKVQEAAPPVPERAVEGVKEDIATVKGQRS
jgi:uncharacterized membrane protein YqjE